MEKMRKHKWITEAINAGEKVLSVWASKEDKSSKKKEKEFLDVIEKIGLDPRVKDVRRVDHPDYGIIFLFDINE